MEISQRVLNLHILLDSTVTMTVRSQTLEYHLHHGVMLLCVIVTTESDTTTPWTVLSLQVRGFFYTSVLYIHS